MSCYRKGGCGPYEMRSCSECPASSPEYALRYSSGLDKVSVGNFPSVGSSEGHIISKEGFPAMKVLFTNEGEVAVECVEVVSWTLNMATGALSMIVATGVVERTRVHNADVALSVLLAAMADASVSVHVHCTETGADLYSGFMRSKVYSGVSSGEEVTEGS